MQALGEGMGKIFCIGKALKIGNYLKAVLSLVSTLLQMLTVHPCLLPFTSWWEGPKSGPLDSADTKIFALSI